MDEPDEEKIFSELGADIRVDTYTLRTAKQAQSIERLIAQSEREETKGIAGTATTLALETLEAMNNECPYSGEPVYVTGQLTMSLVDPETERFTTKDVFVDHLRVTAMGYQILEFDPDTSMRVVKVGHKFLVETLPARNDTPPLVDYLPRILAFASVGMVSIEYEKTDKENSEYLQVNIPGIVGEIDEVIFSTTNEIEALRSLEEFSISKKQDIPNDMLKGLEAYVWQRLGLDEVLPYQFRVSGPAYYTFGSDKFPIQLQQDGGSETLIVFPQSLTLMPYPVIEGIGPVSEVLCWYVHVAVAQNDLDRGLYTMLIPIKSITSARSVRDILFGN